MSENKSRVIWITGLSGAGKTTLARALAARLPEALMLDGDALREALGVATSDFDRDSRLRLALTYSRLCKMLADQNRTVIIATISLFHEVHAWNRQHLPGYLEVFLDVPEVVRRRRDPKGLYAAKTGASARQMAGNGVAVDPPRNPDLQFDETCPVQEAVETILHALKPISSTEPFSR